MLVFVMYKNPEGDTLLNLAECSEAGVWQRWAPAGTVFTWEGGPKVIYSPFQVGPRPADGKE